MTVSHCQQLKLNVSNLSAVPPSPSSIMLCFFFEEFIQRPRIILVNLCNNVVSHFICFLARVYHFSFIQALWILALEQCFLHACRVKTLGFRKIERIMSLNSCLSIYTNIHFLSDTEISEVWTVFNRKLKKNNIQVWSSIPPTCYYLQNWCYSKIPVNLNFIIM